MKKVILPYNKIAKKLIQEGDVLLHRSNAWYSKVIQRMTRSEYSHVSLASWHNGNNLLEIIEFHGLRGGGNTRILSRVVKEESECIDVYRPVRKQQRIKLDVQTLTAQWHTYYFNDKNTTNTMRKLTGLPYGWKRMWWFIKQYLVGLRLFYNMNDIMDDTVKDVVAPVCSTSIAYVFSKNDFDLIPNKSDTCVKPGDLACSPMLNYLFTLKWDDN